MAAKARAALGFSVHIGKAAVVAVGGAAGAPEILGKAALQVATTFEEGAVFHMGQELPLDEARALIRDSEVRFTERARDQLAAFVAQLGARVVAAGMVAAPPKALPPIESILKAHPLVHAAEGELYRRVFSEAAASSGRRAGARAGRRARRPRRCCRGAHAGEARGAAGRDGQGVGQALGGGSEAGGACGLDRACGLTSGRCCR